MGTSENRYPVPAKGDRPTKKPDGFPEKFGIREALGVCCLSLAEAWGGLVHCIAEFDSVRNSVKYNI